MLYKTSWFTRTSHYLTPLIVGLQDCETGIKDFFNSKLYIIGYVGIGIAGVMVSQDVRRVEKTHTQVVIENTFFFLLKISLKIPLNRSSG